MKLPLSDLINLKQVKICNAEWNMGKNWSENTALAGDGSYLFEVSVTVLASRDCGIP
jgi:hypothetical protein